MPTSASHVSLPARSRTPSPAIRRGPACATAASRTPAMSRRPSAPPNSATSGSWRTSRRQRRLVAVLDVRRVGGDQVERACRRRRGTRWRRTRCGPRRRGARRCRAPRRARRPRRRWRRTAQLGSFVRQRHRDAAAAGADVGDARRRQRAPQRRRASSTMNSVSGRGISTAGVTTKSRPQNSRTPTMYAVGSRAIAARDPLGERRLERPGTGSCCSVSSRARSQPRIVRA